MMPSRRVVVSALSLSLDGLAGTAIGHIVFFFVLVISMPCVYV